MARVTKEPEVRRDELLDVALDLCVSVGFESTSVEQITTAAGVAKGTFYHYFASKHDLLVQLVARFGEDLFEHLEREMSTVDGGAVERLQTLGRISGTWKLERLNATMSYLPFLYNKEENYTLRHKFLSMWLERLRPMLFEIVEQGSLDGTFHVGDPEGATTVLLTVWIDGGNRMWERAAGSKDFAETMMAGGAAIIEAQERILGVPKGTFDIFGAIDPKMMEGLRSRLAQQGASLEGTDRNDRGGLT